MQRWQRALIAGKLPDRGRQGLSLNEGIELISVGEAENRAGLGNESVGIEGLGHVEIGADLLAALAIELLALGGEQDDVDVAHAHLVLDGVADVEAVLLGHHDVEEDEVRLFFADGFERLFAVARGEQFDAFVFELFQGLLDQRAQMGFVINDKNLHRRSLVDEEQNVLHAFLEAQGTNGFVTGEQRIQNDDVGLGERRRCETSSEPFDSTT